MDNMENAFTSSPSRPKVQFTFNQGPAKPSSTSPSSTAAGGIFAGHLSGPVMAFSGRGMANSANTNSIDTPNKAQTATSTAGAPRQAQPSGPFLTSTSPQTFTFGGFSNNLPTAPSTSSTNLFGKPSTTPFANPFTTPSTTSSTNLFGRPSTNPPTNPFTGSAASSSTLPSPRLQPIKFALPGGMPHQAPPLLKTNPTPTFFGASSTSPTPSKQTTYPPRPPANPSSGTNMNGDIDHQNAIREHFNLLGGGSVADDAANEVTSAPLFTGPTLRNEHAKLKRSGRPRENFSQYGLLGGVLDDASEGFIMGDFVTNKDPRIFQNVAAPMSAFICGSQGSGKSHTLSCMLENCLLASPASHLPRPLTGLVFHYDSFVGDSGGAPCEAAYLSSHAGVKVKVLCAPTNVGQIRRIYSALPNVTVEEFRINQADLNTKRMMDLMAFNPNGSKGTPLYLHVINRILRDLRIVQQRTNQPFNYDNFKTLVYAEDLTDGQSAPLKQRLDTLESFMVAAQAQAYSNRKKGIKTPQNMVNAGNDWRPKAGQLTIVDMSCPCVTAEMACSLFNIALSLFLEQKSTIGRVVALDEAHKYMVDSMESQTLTESLMATIRLQRHLGARIIIATQEPTISPKLLDLCSVTIVHRFTSPDWLLVLKRHLAGVSSRSAPDTSVKSESVEEQTSEATEKSVGFRPLLFDAQDITQQVFSRIIALRTGEALLFSPTAIVGMPEEKPPTVEVPELVVTVKKETQGASEEPKPNAHVARANSPDTLAALTPVSEVPPDLPSAPAAQAGGEKSLTESLESKMESLFGSRSGVKQQPALENIPPGTSAASFAPTFMHDPPHPSSVAMQNISFQQDFQKWSPDELHLVDHIAGPKPDHQPGTTAASRLSSATGNLVKEEKIPIRLGRGVLKVRIRSRVTSDGGRSVFAI